VPDTLLPGTTRVGVLGVGRMGLPIARVLRTAGLEVFAYDSDLSGEGAIREAGITPTSNADALAAGIDVPLTVLPDRESAHAGRGWILALRAGALWIDLSSGDQRRSESAMQAARVRGIRTVSAPMRGGPPGAASGDLDSSSAARKTTCARPSRS